MSPDSCISRNAEFGVNYDVGYIGFTFFDESIVSQGIAYFTHWYKMSNIKVSHAFIVTGENECVEALLSKNVVAKSPLDKYINDDKCKLYFRKPKEWIADVGKVIADSALKEVGEEYDFSLILADAAAGSLAGHWINKIFKGKPNQIACKILNKEHEWICSELAAYCLKASDLYNNKGILRKDCDAITPQELFEDNIIFEPWK